VNGISNLGFGSRFAWNQTLIDTNFAASNAHIFASNMVNEFRFSLVRRDLDFPENDPSSPTATITGVFTVGGNSNFPQRRVTNSYQFSNTTTRTLGRHTLKFGADVRHNDADNISGFDTKGTFLFNNLEDFVNNEAFRFTTRTRRVWRRVRADRSRSTRTTGRRVSDFPGVRAPPPGCSATGRRCSAAASALVTTSSSTTC
jgi:hypothetical protein